MPIHLRAEPGDYAPAVLIPGDPRRAEYVARTFFEGARRVNEERGMLGFTGTFEGKPISVQATGMGCPSAAIVVEELAQLGVKRVVRIGTCGGLAEGLALGDVSSRSRRRRPTRRRRTSSAASRTRRRPTSSSSTPPSTSRATRARPCASARSCRRTSSTTRTPAVPALAGARHARRRDGGGGRLHARRRCAASRPAACSPSRTLIVGEFVRISDEELRAAVDRMTELAIRAALSEPKG